MSVIIGRRGDKAFFSLERDRNSRNTPQDVAHRNLAEDVDGGRSCGIGAEPCEIGVVVGVLQCDVLGAAQPLGKEPARRDRENPVMTQA